MLGRSEREGFGNLKGSGTERATVVRNDGVSKQPFDLTLGVLQKSFVGSTGWERVGILGVNLRENDEDGAVYIEMLNGTLYLGYVIRVGESGRIYFVL